MSVILGESVLQLRAAAMLVGSDVLAPRRPSDALIASIDQLDEAIGGLSLPAELRTWWTDWDVSSLGFLAESAVHFLEPPECLEEWRFLPDVEIPRILMPFAREEKRVIALELTTDSHPGGRLFEIDFHGDGVRMIGIGVADFLTLIAEALERSARSTKPNPYPGPLDADTYEDLLQERLAPWPSVFTDGPGYSAWPLHWRAAEGVDEDIFRIRGRTHSVWEFDVARESEWPLVGVLQGEWRTHVSGGPLGGSVGRLRDASGSLRIFVPDGIPDGGHRHRTLVEIEVVGVPDSGPGLGSVPGSCEAIAALTAGDEAEFHSQLFEALESLEHTVVATAIRPLER